ncbi:MAG: response regulator [Pseudomonadota bacterium]
MNTPDYKSPPKEVLSFDYVHILLHQSKLEVQLRKEKRLEIGGGNTVLVVDDDPILLSIASSMLTRLGFTSLETTDSVEAVEVFKQHSKSICCVLCDLMMPQMNGWETLKALRRLAPGLPVMLSSGYVQTELFEGDHPELPQVFLGKPYSLNELREAILKALEKSIV